jgi:DnaJ homolog subfamily C member 3
MRWCAISTILALVGSVLAGEPGALSPPGLQPLINRANALLSSGQFLDAANAYSEAIGAYLTH